MTKIICIASVCSRCVSVFNKTLNLTSLDVNWYGWSNPRCHGDAVSGCGIAAGPLILCVNLSFSDSLFVFDLCPCRWRVLCPALFFTHNATANTWDPCIPSASCIFCWPAANKTHVMSDFHPLMSSEICFMISQKLLRDQIRIFCLVWMCQVCDVMSAECGGLSLPFRLSGGVDGSLCVFVCVSWCHLHRMCFFHALSFFTCEHDR